MDEDEFSQGFILPPLITQLRKILDQYPDDTQILKELIQNAEDAGAKVIRFLYDKHTYGTDKKQLHDPGLARFQGPALYAYNDGLFSEDDWRGLRMLSDSVKQNDPFKVGYFGMGFKSVFHMTDLPSVLSGDKLGMIDPNQFFFPASSHGWNIAKHPELIQTMRHQLDPYIGVFGCEEQSFRDGYYKGTLFRFPLRISGSPLSSEQYTQDKIYALFECFKQEAHLLLLFLRNLEKIEVYERDRFVPNMKLLFSVEIGDDCIENVRAKRTSFLQRTRTSDWLDKPIVSTYPMTVETQSLKHMYLEKVSFVSYRYLITSYYCGGHLSAAFSKLHKDTELNFLPWVGTAMPLNDPTDGRPNIYDLTDDDGHIFCFLPLPMEQNSSTGLPVHVNGFFALEQNRKHIKWPVTYKTRDDLMDKRLLWNQCILKEALPKAYSHMLLEAIQMHAVENSVSLEMVYRAFPDFSKVDRKWESILPIIYSDVFKYPTLYTAAEGGKWIEPRHAVFNTLGPNEAASDVILQVLAVGSVKIVDSPSHVLQAVKKCCHINIGQVVPTLVASTYRAVQYDCSLHWDEKMKLLRYFLQQSKLDILDGLNLLPLANGGFEIFHYNPRKADRPIYIAITPDIYQLLPGLSDDFLEMDLDKDIKKNLTKAASRGFTQLKIIDASLLAQLIPQCLPKSWQNGRGVVEWMPGEPGHPPAGWLELLWNFLVTTSPRDLSAVEKLPILPGRTLIKQCEEESSRAIKVIELVPLTNSRVSIARQMDGISLGTEMEEIASKIGITVVDDLPDFIKLHPLITKSYIFSSSYIGVLRAFVKLGAMEGQERIAQRIFEDTTPEEKRCLCQLFAKISGYEMLPEYHSLLSHLPIFETLEGSGGGRESHFVSAAEVRLAAPCEKASFPLSRLLLDISSTESQTLARLLGIPQLNLVQLLTQVVFQDIENGFYTFPEVQNVMQYVLRHYHQFMEIDPSFQAILRNLAFLEKRDLLLTADRFYDPDHELLQKMFQLEEKFPSGAYSDPAIVAILREIGLRGVQDVDADDIREAALCIESLSQQDDVLVEKLVEKSVAILEYLQRNQSKLNVDCNGAKLAELMSDIAWVRHMPQHPAFYPASLKWFGEGRIFNKPSEMTSRKYFNIVGSVMWIASVDVPSSIEQAFEWDKEPPVEVIVKHLANVVRSYDPREKVLYMELCRAIYSELTKHNLEEVKSVLEQHVGDDWIWNGEGFVSSNRVVFSQPFMDLRPFIFSLPAEMTMFSEFLANFGVQKLAVLTEVLKMIRKKHGDSENLQLSAAEVKRDLNFCVSILNELKSHITDEESLAAVQNDLYLPVHVEGKSVVLKMAPLQDCTYCDEEWIRQGYSYSDFGMTDDEHIALVHPNVPTSTSEALGVPTLMSRMLDAEELDISFGQTDSLTHRLNTLLQEYSDGFAVPKELIQNADDAGATEVKFLYDERENEDARTCLIDEGMRDCQGPAIWVYNDAVFQDEDFENITKLSGATKESQPDKIGRFGLGFNAVYNLTDVPSFVSRHSIVIFDPQLVHLGKSIKNKYKPGIRIDLRRHRRNLRRFGNQFKPYNEVFGCNLKPDSDVDFYDGTLFRFPLRTKVQAHRSEICNKHYDDKEVKELLKMLANAGESLLLFTQNVVKITVYHLPKKGVYQRDLAEVFHLKKRPIKVIRELTPLPKLSSSAEGLAEDLKHFISQCSVLKASVEAMSRLKSGANVESVPTPDSSIAVELERWFASKTSLTLDAALSKTKKQCWLICNYFGTGESMRMALQEENLLSTVGVAVPIEADGNGYKPVPLTDLSNQNSPSGSVFSYMPLPIRNGLPVHINGSFYVTSNRKYLCQQNEDDKFDMRPVWNNALMKDAMCGVYVRMLSDLAVLSESVKDYCFHQLWPNPRYVSSYCEPLLKGFYKYITNSENSDFSSIFSDGVFWRSIDNTKFLEFDYAKTDVGQTAEDVFRLCLAETGDIVASLPTWMQEAFDSSGVQNSIASNAFGIVRFFHKIFLPNINKVDGQQRDRLLLDALHQNDEHLFASVADVECIPVTPQGERLRFISDLVDPTSLLAQLYIPDDERFPFGASTYCNFEILQVLRSIGMKHALEHITWDDLIERATAVAGSTDPSSARTIVTGLLAIMNQKLAEDDIRTRRIPLRSIQEQLSTIAFLPVMKKPTHFPLPWKGSETPNGMLLKPSELYPCQYKDLVGCVRPIVDSTVFPANADALQTFLKISSAVRNPTVEDALDQLDVIISPASQALLNTNDFDEIQKLSFKVCEFLQSKCGNAADRRILKSDLPTKNFILAHNRFLSPGQVAFKFLHNCVPYLYSLPDYHKRNFTELLSIAGVKDHFDAQSYIFALQDMHSRHTDEELDKDTLKLALQLVSLLNDRMAEQGQTLTELVDTLGAINIPDAKGILRSAAELCYNEPDCQWVPTSDSSFSHPLIPFAISKQLGVNTSRLEVLRRHSRGIPFGQRERLTNRIKRILSGYPCDKEILKELLQNADDAGASEITFIKDSRQHGTERVFDKSFRPLQGPALCVYSNRAFTETDLEAIQRLGEGSKSADPNKTGQYGVGFNCVYHLTDAPSFLTRGPDIGESLCIFDPHAKFVPGASVEEPGRRFQDVAELRNIFTDVFSCYLEDRFDITNGTMFRFPLRDEKMARESELSDQVITLDTIESLFAKFRTEMLDCLLFLNNISKITLCEIDKLTGKFINTYSLLAKLSDEEETSRRNFAQHLQQVGSKLKSGEVNLTDIGVCKLNYTVMLSDSKGYWEKWMVSQQFGFEKSVEIPASVLDSFRRKELMLMPRGGVAALIDASDKAAAKRRTKRIFCFLPLPLKSDLPVNINGHFALDHEARRSLWQDDDSGSKTEWNKLLICKAIAPCYSELLRCMSFALSDSVVSETLTLMNVSETGIVNGMSHFCQLFPRVVPDATGYWSILGEAVYQRIHEVQERVLPVVRKPDESQSASSLNSSEENPAGKVQAEVEWLATNDHSCQRPCFDHLDETFADSEEQSGRKHVTSTPIKMSRSRILRQVLLSSGFKLLSLPLDVYDSFTAAGIEVHYITPSRVVDFYRLYDANGKSSCLVGLLPAHISSTPFKNEWTLKIVLQYCLQDSYYFLSDLNGLPLLLTEDEQLHQFSSNRPVYLSSFYDLLPGLGHKFCHRQFVDSIFKESDVESNSVFLPFDVDSFAGLLPHVLSKEKFCRNDVVPVERDDEDMICDKVWLFKVWRFLRHNYERTMDMSESGCDCRATAVKTLTPLQNWNLLPAHIIPASNISSISGSRLPLSSLEESSDRVLVPVKMAGMLLDYSQAGIISWPLKQCLRKLCVPELNSEMLDTGTSSSPSSKHIPSNFSFSSLALSSNNSAFAKLLVSTLDDPQSVLRAINHAVHQEHQESSRTPLHEDECLILLKYFSDSLDAWKQNLDSQTHLRSAPLHITVQGDVTSLSDHLVYLLQEDVPSNDLHVWNSREGIIFLKANASFHQLYETLGCQVISVSRLYLDFIFKSFDYLTVDGQISHLEFLRDSHLTQVNQDERSAVLRALGNLEFIPLADGTLHAASKFFDPHHPVYKEMMGMSPSAFPSPPFSELKWLEFLRLIGLQDHVSIDQFVTFAWEVADEGKTDPTEQTINKSKTLVTQMFKMENLPKSGLLERVMDIPFILASRGKPMHHKVHPAFNCSVENEHLPAYIAFQEGIPEHHEVLVWSSAYLLPDWANPYKLTEQGITFKCKPSEMEVEHEKYRNLIGSALKIRHNPPIPLVIRHMLQLCKDDCVTNGSDSEDFRAYLRMDVMKRIYQYLQSCLADDNRMSEDVETAILGLAEAPCIVSDLGQKFVKPKQVVIELYEEDQIIPYLYKAPTELGEFRNLFLQLGASSCATPEQYAKVLECIHDKTGDAKLHPNELRLVLKAVTGFFTALLKQVETSKSSTLEKLYLPTNMGQLLDARQIIYNDEPTWAERVKNIGRPFLINLAECKLTPESYLEAISFLPKEILPSMLSSFVKEVLEENLASTRESNVVAEKLKYQLGSKAFAQGVARLIKHEHRRSGSKAKQHILERVQVPLKNVEVYNVDSVITYLLSDGQKIVGSELESECFVERKLDENGDLAKWEIYIKKMLKLEEEVQVSIADAVNRITGGYLKNSIQYVQPMLTCPPHSISKVLDRLKVRPDHHHGSDQLSSVLPACGSFIPLEDHHLLKQDIEEFETGEYVGYELDDELSGEATIVYATVVRKSAPAADSSDSEAQCNGFTNGHHRILIQRYLINIGEERDAVVVSSTDLYKFERLEHYMSRLSANVTESLSAGGSLTKSPRTPVSEAQLNTPPAVFEPLMESADGSNTDRNICNGIQVENGNYALQKSIGGTSKKSKPVQKNKEILPLVIDSADQNSLESDSSSSASGDFNDQNEKESLNNEETENERETVEQLMNEISDSLEDAWHLPDAERRKIIKRLLLKWHPDKNLDNQSVSTIITQHIYAEVERLEMGLPRPKKFEEFQGQFDFDPRNPFANSTTFQQNFYNAYQYFFEQMNRRAKEHKEQRERYKENFSREYGPNRFNYNCEVPPSFSSTNPQPAQAKRFFRQGQEDLRASRNDYKTDEPAFEWVCFKAHQAAEKALKAAQFHVDAISSLSHDLVCLAASLEDIELRRLAQKLQHIVGNSNKLYNPDPIDFVVIPHDEYTEEMSLEAVSIAKDILARVKEIIEFKE